MTNKDIYKEIKFDLKYIFFGALGISEYQSFYVVSICALLTRLFIYSIIGYCIYDAYIFTLAPKDITLGLIGTFGFAFVCIAVLIGLVYIGSILIRLFKVNLYPFIKLLCTDIKIQKRK